MIRVLGYGAGGRGFYFRANVNKNIVLCVCHESNPVASEIGRTSNVLGFNNVGLSKKNV